MITNESNVPNVSLCGDKKRINNKCVDTYEFITYSFKTYIACNDWHDVFLHLLLCHSKLTWVSCHVFVNRMSDFLFSCLQRQMQQQSALRVLLKSFSNGSILLCTTKKFQVMFQHLRASGLTIETNGFFGVSFILETIWPIGIDTWSHLLHFWLSVGGGT